MYVARLGFYSVILMCRNCSNLNVICFLIERLYKWHNVMAGFFADYTFVDFSSPANFIADYTFIHFADPPSPHRQLSASWIKRRHALTVDMSYHHMTYHIWHITDHLVSRNPVKEKNIEFILQIQRKSHQPLTS